MNRVVDRCKSLLVFLVLVTMVVLSATPASAQDPDPMVGTGHITAGVFTAHTLLTWSLGLHPGMEGLPYEFTLPAASHQGTVIEAVVEDGGGLGYFVEMAFYDGSRRADTDCTATEDSHALMEPPVGTAEIRKRCLVPPGADIVVVYAHTGLDLDVTVVVAQDL